MLSFACTTVACLIMHLGHGRVTVDDGKNFVYATNHFKETYFCSRSATSISCRRMDGTDCPITKPWENQFGRHQSEFDCR